jgi:ribosomal protein S18 acetylase RimI-like enzyme
MEPKSELQPDAISESLRCRPQFPEDEAFLREVYGTTRKEELDLTDWSSEQRKVFLDSQFRAMRQAYTSQFRQGEFLVIIMGEQPIGLMVVNRAQTELRLVDIALLPEFRGRGIGSFYLKKLASEAALAQKPLRLHVFKGSRPWRLYERLGFVKIEDHGLYEHLEWRPPSACQNLANGDAKPGD